MACYTECNICVTLVLCSIELIEPMLDSSERLRPTWISWKAHVRMASFCLRYVYDLSVDVPKLQGMLNDYDSKFHAAYPNKEYSKPKKHFKNHLPKYLSTCGPFRNYSCLSGRGTMGQPPQQSPTQTII